MYIPLRYALLRKSLPAVAKAMAGRQDDPSTPAQGEREMVENLHSCQRLFHPIPAALRYALRATQDERR